MFGLNRPSVDWAAAFEHRFSFGEREGRIQQHEMVKRGCGPFSFA